MKIFWEGNDWPGATIDSGVTCLSWITSNGSDSCSDTGLLATGSQSGLVGVTATTITPSNDNKRCNFNLRGHHSAVSIVAWNREEMKLASCDASGIIYVWVPNEERWSVELVNDRGIKVRGVCWSPSGSSALICYEDNFVLIGSAIGQRIWSSSFVDTVNCGVWAPDSREIILGFGSGQIQVLTEQGTTVTQRILYTNCSIDFLASSPVRKNGKWTLAVCSSSGLIQMLESYDEVGNAQWQSKEALVNIQWNFNGTLLVVISKQNLIEVLNHEGHLVLSTKVPYFGNSPITAFTWAHENHIVVAAKGGKLAVGSVCIDVPSLFSLVSYNVWSLLGASTKQLKTLKLPSYEKDAIRRLDHHIIRCRVPSQVELLSKVCGPSDWRWYCTIKPVPHKPHTYELCVEHMAGLVPILVGKQTNRIVPQFFISLYKNASVPSLNTLVDGGSSAQVEDVDAFLRPSNHRNSVWRRSKRQLRAMMNRHVTSRQLHRRTNKLVQVVYKTSVLHLQPRQMTVQLADLSKRNISGDQCIAYNSGRAFFSLANDSCYANELNTHAAAIVPSERPDVLGRRLELDEEPLIDDAEEEPLSLEERLLFQSVLVEFNDLRSVVERHIERMKCFACDLERSSQKLDPYSNGAPIPTSNVLRCAPKISTVSRDDASAYIDEDDAVMRRNPNDRAHLIESVQSTESRKSTRQFNDISSILDKLSKLANDLTTRCTVGQLSTDALHSPIRNFKIMRNENQATVSSLRSQLRDISKKVSQIEKKITYGDELVGEVCGDLQQRIQHIKTVLGEQQMIGDEISFLTMNNKAPLWNQDSQVYQLDFGGRVTQESAKNFQIDYENKQVMQFGRIENGAYTLDFRAPFCAVQAFAVALASITQRLK